MTHERTSMRKENHVDICIGENVGYAARELFSDVELLHNPLPELDFDSIITETEFVGKKISAPIIINSMTGGAEKVHGFNKKLAESAEKHNIPLGLGSLRAVLENSNLIATFEVRNYAPSIPIFGNIGMAQVRNATNTFIDNMKTIVDKLNLDALAVHLNPLQEIVQAEGDTNFSDCFEGIKHLKKSLGIPIIVKETGAGINEFAAYQLDRINVDYIDVSGAGGTSWSKVEYMRKGARVEGFGEWGTHTAFLLPTVSRAVKRAKVIAGGGIYNGIIIAKAIALGADYCASARNFLIAVAQNNFDSEYEKLTKQLRTAMLLTGSKNIAQLKKANLIIHSTLRSMLLSAQVDCSQFYFR